MVVLKELRLVGLAKGLLLSFEGWNGSVCPRSGTWTWPWFGVEGSQNSKEDWFERFDPSGNASDRSREEKSTYWGLKMNNKWWIFTPLGWASPWFDVPGDSLFTFTPMERLSSLGWTSTGSSIDLPPTELLKVGKSWFKVSRSVLGNCYSCKHTQWWSGNEIKGHSHQRAHQSTRKTNVTASNQHTGLTEPSENKAYKMYH